MQRAEYATESPYPHPSGDWTVHRFVRLASAMGAVALLCAWMVPVRADDISGAGATFPYPVYAKWAEAYKQQDRHRSELPVDRFGRRYQADRSLDRHLRGVGQTARARRSEAERTGAVAADHRRRGAGGEHPGHQARRPGAGRADTSPASTWATSHAGTTRPSRSSIPSLNLPKLGHRTGVPLGRFRHQFPVHQLPVAGEPEHSPRPSAPTPRCSGRWASAPRATRASPIRPRRPAARSATSNTPTSSRPT